MSRRAARRSASEGVALVTLPCETQSCDEVGAAWSVPSDVSVSAAAVIVAMETKSAARIATDRIKPSRRMRPPSRVRARVSDIVTKLRSKSTNLVKNFSDSLHGRYAQARSADANGGGWGVRRPTLSRAQAPDSTGRFTSLEAPAGSESQRVISTLFSVKKRTPSLPVACRSP